MIRKYRYGEIDEAEIFDRSFAEESVEDAVREIIEKVRNGGDAALSEYCERFDGFIPNRERGLEVEKSELRAAYREAKELHDEKSGLSFAEILEEAAENIREFHGRQLREGFRFERNNGVVLGQKFTPIERVGIYVPGGTAAYPSTVLMNAIPAKIAGCGEIVMCTPSKGGKIASGILAAAEIAGVDRVFRIGGAQAVAALAYGTESVPRVHKITGPGNAFVAEAKRQVYGSVDIDMIAGPSDILVLADSACDPRFVAADMLSQAEHDRLASAVLICDSEALCDVVALEIERQLSELPREEIARASIENNGKIILCDSLEQGVEIANRIAPEHLELCVEEPFYWLDKVKNAGSVFLGRDCPEALGDYFTGPNHTLPTGGRALFANPLSVDDFVKKTQFSYYPREALLETADKVAFFARQEGLEAHARSALSRRDWN